MPRPRSYLRRLDISELIIPASLIAVEGTKLCIEMLLEEGEFESPEDVAQLEELLERMASFTGGDNATQLLDEFDYDYNPTLLPSGPEPCILEAQRILGKKQEGLTDEQYDAVESLIGENSAIATSDNSYIRIAEKDTIDRRRLFLAEHLRVEGVEGDMDNLPS
jgi:hypothetical protein